jgi:hypothetical protein
VRHSLLIIDYLAKLIVLLFSDVYENGSLFIRPFREYSKAVHAGTFVCRAENAAGSIQTTPIQLRPRKNTFNLILYRKDRYIDLEFHLPFIL